MIRYRIDEGKYIFHEFLPNQKYNKDVWLDTEDKFQRKIETIVDSDGNEQNIDAGYYTYYLPDMVDGKYLPDEVKEQEAIDEAEALVVKQGKDEALEQLVVTTNLVPFDANAQSINYMSSVIALASAEYCLITSQGTSPAEAYNAIFKTVIPWKNADNTISQVQLETVKEALRDAMTAVGTIKTGV